METQANGYEAFFQTFWHLPWFDGAFFWKWYPDPQHAGRARHVGFTPQGKLAEQVMARWYGATAK